jgi:hypothetical protein
MRPMTCPTLLDDSTANNAIPHGNDRCGNPDRRHTLVSPIRRRLAVVSRLTWSTRLRRTTAAISLFTTTPLS